MANVLSQLDIEDMRRIFDSLESVDEKRSFLDMLEKRERLLSENRLMTYAPYPKQIEFHAASSKWSEVLFMGSNQSGKSVAAAAHTAIIATGLYDLPCFGEGGFPGRRWNRPIRIVIASESNQLCVNGMQRLLFGNPENPDAFGTGMIPKHLITSHKKKPGVVNGIESATIKHASGMGDSSIRFLSYEMGRSKIQAETADAIVLDEESPSDFYFEALTRISATDGQLLMVFTPLKGKSAVVERYWPAPAPEMAHLVGYVQMGIQDVGHFSEKQRADLLAKYPPHEHGPRLRGIPMFGSGRVITSPEADYVIPPFKIPDHFWIGGGMDFGIGHDSGFVACAWDPDEDVFYVTHCYKAADKKPYEFYHATESWGVERWFWPHDGLQREKGSGEALAAIYRDAKFPMWHEKAHMLEKFPNGKTLEPSIFKINNLIAEGKFKVFSNLTPLLEEMREFHRDEEGKIVALKDDAFSAVRYAFMMTRHFKPKTPEKKAKTNLSTRSSAGW